MSIGDVLKISEGASASYRLLTWVLGVAYAAMYPVFTFAPVAFYFLLRQPEDAFTDAIKEDISTLFLNLMGVIAPSYFIAVYLDDVVLIDVTVLHRLFMVGPCVVLTAIFRQDPFQDSLSVVLLMFASDFVGGLAHGLLAPRGLVGTFDRFWAHWRRTPQDQLHRDLRLEAYTGMIRGQMSLIYSVTVLFSEPLSVMQVLVTVQLYYNFVWYAALETGNTATKHLPYVRLWSVLVLLLISELYGRSVAPFRLQALAIIVGMTSPKLSAAFNCIACLYLYVVMSAFVLTVPHGAMYWLILWAAITWFASEFWLFLFWDTYNEKQQKRIKGTNWQDRILAFFMVGVGSALFKGNALGMSGGWMSDAVVYLLPTVTMWFSLETKYLTHIWTGTPFHPSWWCDGEVPKYHESDWVNMTFSISTVLITVVLTSFAFVSIVLTLGTQSFAFASESLWKFACVHGMLYVFHTGYWMILASSGVPYMGRAPMFQTFPPEAPPLLRCNPKNCLPMHKVDLAIGTGLMLLGGFCIQDGALTTAEEMAFKYVVFALWFLCTLNKVYIHYSNWGYVAPVELAAKEEKRD